MIDGTYLHLGNGVMTRLTPPRGYWVGLRPVQGAIKKGAIIGYWTDSDGTVYRDYSQWFDSLSQALEVALDHDQLAIWDIENNREIIL